MINLGIPIWASRVVAHLILTLHSDLLLAIVLGGQDICTLNISSRGCPRHQWICMRKKNHGFIKLNVLKKGALCISVQVYSNLLHYFLILGAEMTPLPPTTLCAAPEAS